MVKVLESCVRTLQGMESRTCCFLTGFESEKGEQILSVIKAADCWLEGPTPKINWEQELDAVTARLPAGVRAYGFAMKADSQDVVAGFFSELDKAEKLLGKQVRSTFYFLSQSSTGSKPLLAVAEAEDVVFYRDKQPVQIEMINATPALLACEHVLVRCCMPLYLQV